MQLRERVIRLEKERWEHRLSRKGKRMSGDWVSGDPEALGTYRSQILDLFEPYMYFRRRKNLLQRLWIAKLFEGDFYAFCEKHLEKMEDEFAQALGSSQLRGSKGTTAPLIDDVTSACAAILHKAAALHGSGLRIVA